MVADGGTARDRNLNKADRDKGKQSYPHVSL